MRTEIFDSVTILSIALLSVLILYILIGNYFSKDKSRFWSPMTFIAMVFFYYTIVPFPNILNGDTYYIGINMATGISYSYLGACISLFSIFVGYHLYNNKKRNFKLDKYLNKNNALKIGLILYGIALAGYIPFRGLQLNITQTNEQVVFDNSSGLQWYFISFILFLVFSVCLFIYVLSNDKKYRWLLIPLIVLAIIIYIVGGFRYRLVILLISAVTVYYLHSPKRLNLILWIPVLIAFVFFMGVMQYTRNYARGLDLSRIEGFSSKDILRSGTEEATGVFYFSGVVMEKYSKQKKFYFEPLVNALLMPIPRTIFPNKPEAEYIKEANMAIFGTADYGAAYTNYTESYISFGWIGVILNGLFIGMISKFFWLNFRRNKNNLGPVISLALYNGFTYVLISRGYLAQELTLFFFFIIIPIWIGKQFNILSQKKYSL